jgi:RimJ/RimL family protein N-acetyltransferase
LGLPTLLVTAYDNQRRVARGLAEAGAVLPLGWHEEVTAEAVAEALRRLAKDPAAVAAMARRAAALCDARGAERAWLAVDEERCAAGLVTLRLAEAGDLGQLYDWQSAPETRRYAKTSSVPTRAEHEAWFARMSADPGCLIAIIACDGRPAGSLRLDRRGGGRERLVSIYLAAEAWGNGIATGALDLVRRLAPGWRFVAEVLPGNDASHRLFRRAGYREEQPGTYIREAAA